MDDNTYQAALLQAYEAEIVNEAWFLAMADRMQEPRHKQCLDLLAEVERQAAAAILPLLQRHGLVPGRQGDLHARGRAEAQASSLDSWDGLLRHISEDYPKYIDEFRELEMQAPPAEREALRRLTQHEVVTIEFARRELAGEREPLSSVRRYLGD